MKKDRNVFFSEYGYNANMTMPNNMPNQNMMGNTISANSNFYSGPANPNMNSNMNNNMYSDIDSRLSKIERRISRLEARVNHLEGDNSSNITYEDNNYSSNMYMV